MVSRIAAPHRLVPLLAALAWLSVSCAAPPRSTDSSAAVNPPVNPSVNAPVEAPAIPSADGQSDIARLEREARALAKAEGCATADACRTAPLGSRACGGPRAYVVYCAATTDSVALYRTLDSLRDAESAFNQRSGMVSTCEMRLPPMPEARGGRCTDGR